VAYHPAGSRRGTATLKFYEGRDNLLLALPARRQTRESHSESQRGPASGDRQPHRATV